MAAAYSLDLRKKILSAWENQEGSQRELAKRFKVSLSFIRNFLRRYRQTGEIAARAQGGDRRSLIKEENIELVEKLISQKNDIYLREIQKELQERENIQVSVSSLCRKLKKLEQVRKKKSNSD